MELKFKSLLFSGLLAISFCSVAEAQEPEKEAFVSGQSSEALAMLEERFASLSGSLGKMSTPPKLSGTLSLPPQMNGRISLPGAPGNLTQTQEGDKR